MIAHAPFRRMAVAAIDTRLTTTEQTRLEAHLAGCDACRSYAACVRRDAASLRAIAIVHAPDRVRNAVVRAAVRPASRQAATWRMLAVAAILVLGLVGSALVVGALVRLQAERTGPIGWQPVVAPDVLTDPTTGIRLTGVAGLERAGGSRFVAIGASGAGVTRILVSGDGVRWTLAEDTAFVEAALRGVETVAIGGRTRFVAYGSDAGRPATWWSDDGTIWTVERVHAGAGAIGGVAARLDRLVGLGTRGDRPAFWYRDSAAGSWAAGSVATGDTAPALASIPVAISTGFLGLADGTTFRSLNGIDWSADGNDLPASPRFAVVERGALMVAVGGLGPRPAAWTSTDGPTWVEVPAPGPESGFRAAIVATDERLVAVGSTSAGGQVWYSADGRSWSPGVALPSGTGGRVADVAVAGDRIVAVGSIGTDGAIWQGTEVGP
ncbi:MAG: zf-HC2 domain-containing protein [Chloroflexi bacterium]|nr:zf-HC2 domain-containing protein [Chloroflexota bacterium]